MKGALEPQVQRRNHYTIACEILKTPSRGETMEEFGGLVFALKPPAGFAQNR